LNGNPAFEGFKGIGDSREFPAAIGVWVLCGVFFERGIQLKLFFCVFVGLAYCQGKDIVFRFIIEYIVAQGILAPR
jgi:hypothetical protein